MLPYLTLQLTMSQNIQKNLSLLASRKIRGFLSCGSEVFLLSVTARYQATRRTLYAKCLRKKLS